MWALQVLTIAPSMKKTAVVATRRFIHGVANGGSVAGRGAAVGERPARLGDEAPLVAARMQGELEDAEGIGVADLAVRLYQARRSVVPATGADDELPDAAHRVRGSGSLGRCRRPLWREALVAVGVPAQQDVGARGVEVIPQRRHLGVVADVSSGRPARMVPVRQRAGCRVRPEIRREPLLLRRAGGASAS